MKAYIILCVTFLIAFYKGKSQSDSSQFRFAHLSENVFTCNKDSIMVIVDRTTLIKAVLCKKDEIEFVIGFDLKKDKIVYYTTNDSNFLIKGFRYLTREKAILDSLKRNGVLYEYDWGIYLPISEGWNLRFSLSDLKIKKGQPYLRKGALPISLFKKETTYISFRGDITPL